VKKIKRVTMLVAKLLISLSLLVCSFMLGVVAEKKKTVERITSICVREELIFVLHGEDIHHNFYCVYVRDKPIRKKKKGNGT